MTPDKKCKNDCNIRPYSPFLFGLLTQSKLQFLASNVRIFFTSALVGPQYQVQASWNWRASLFLRLITHGLHTDFYPYSGRVVKSRPYSGRLISRLNRGRWKGSMNSLKLRLNSLNFELSTSPPRRAQWISTRFRQGWNWHEQKTLSTMTKF